MKFENRVNLNNETDKEIENFNEIGNLCEEIAERYKNKKILPKKDFVENIYSILKNKKEVLDFFNKCYSPLHFSIRTNTLIRKKIGKEMANRISKESRLRRGFCNKNVVRFWRTWKSVGA